MVGAARSYNIDMFEQTFNSMVDAAVADYPIFLANIGKKPSTLESDVVINFSDLFEYVIDIKKRETELSTPQKTAPTSGPLDQPTVVSSVQKNQRSSKK